eukprot:6182348-Pleurochrysis_carterae.AAC.2
MLRMRARLDFHSGLPRPSDADLLDSVLNTRLKHRVRDPMQWLSALNLGQRNNIQLAGLPQRPRDGARREALLELPVGRCGPVAAHRCRLPVQNNWATQLE